MKLLTASRVAPGEYLAALEGTQALLADLEMADGVKGGTVAAGMGMDVGGDQDRGGGGGGGGSRGGGGVGTRLGAVENPTSTTTTGKVLGRRDNGSASVMKVANQVHGIVSVRGYLEGYSQRLKDEIADRPLMPPIKRGAQYAAKDLRDALRQERREAERFVGHNKNLQHIHTANLGTTTPTPTPTPTMPSRAGGGHHGTGTSTSTRRPTTLPGAGWRKPSKPTSDEGGYMDLLRLRPTSASKATEEMFVGAEQGRTRRKKNLPTSTGAGGEGGEGKVGDVVDRIVTAQTGKGKGKGKGASEKGGKDPRVHQIPFRRANPGWEGREHVSEDGMVAWQASEGPEANDVEEQTSDSESHNAKSDSSK